MTLPARLRLGRIDVRALAPTLAAAAVFVVLFREPATTLVRDWWHDPEAGHGLLLAPLAVYLAWKVGVRPDARPAHLAGLGLLAAAVLLRYLAGLAAELFTLRLSMLGAAAGLVVFGWGFGQLRRWWLPASLLVLSVPVPAVVLGSVAFPLQLKASQFGASLLAWRHVPVQLAGNVINLPGRSLFVTEACSGLRSLTALIALGLLVGGLWLRSPLSRLVLLASTLPVAILLNGFRVFLTGFLVHYVDPALGDGFMHYTEGWAIFVIAFGILGLMAWGLGAVEHTLGRRSSHA